jgi:type I restriction enzyme, R subunit
MKQAVLTGDNLEIGQLEEFRKTAAAFTKAYDFFSQFLDCGDTRIEKLAIYLKLLSKAIRPEVGEDGLDLSEVVLTHYALKKQEAADLKLTDGDSPGLKGITAAGSGLVREKKKGTFAELIKRINKLFEGTGVSDEDQINVISSVMLHAENNEQLQREAIAKGPIDFAASPTLPEAIEKIVYVAGDGHQRAINALLEMADGGGLVDLLIRSGLQQCLRDLVQHEAADLG